MTADELRERTQQFASQVRGFCRPLLRNPETRDSARQLMRAAASVAANYRSTCISRSRPEFVARMGTVLEEADEALFWADHLGAECAGPVFDAVLQESHEMAAIFGASYRTARANLKAAEEAEAAKAAQLKSAAKLAKSAKSAKSAKLAKSAKSAKSAK